MTDLVERGPADGVSCPRCGQRLAGGELFCGSCGAATRGTAGPPTAPAPAPAPTPTARPADDAQGLPSRAPTIVVTLLFGVFGAIPAYLASSRARALGRAGSRYWTAFVVTLVVPFALVVAGVVVAVLVLAGSDDGSGSTSARAPVGADLPVPSTDPTTAAAGATGTGPLLTGTGIEVDGATAAIGGSCEAAVDAVGAVLGSTSQSSSARARTFTFGADDYLRVYCAPVDDTFLGWTYYSTSTIPSPPTTPFVSGDGLTIGDASSGIDAVGSTPSVSGELEYTAASSGVTYLVDVASATITGFEAGTFQV